MYAVNHVSQKAKGEISNYCVSRKQQFRSRGQITSKVSSEKNTKHPVDTDDEQFNQDKADGHLQTGNRKKNRQVEFERQAKELKQ